MEGGGPGKGLEAKSIKKEGMEINQAKLWAIQVSKLAKMKVNLQHRSLFNIMALYSYPHIDQSSIKAPDRMYQSPLCSGKAASKSRPLKFRLCNLRCSLFMCLCILGEKSKLICCNGQCVLGKKNLQESC